MKFSTWSLLIVILCVSLACDKGDMKDKEKDLWGKEDKIEACKDWSLSEVSDPEIWEEIINEPVIVDEACGCIVSGEVKYWKKDTDFAYVIYYGKGDCDDKAYLVSYYDKDGKKTEKCVITLDCEAGG